MTHKEFYTLRIRIGKTQREMAFLLGVSLKAVESYEQGWRRIPDNIERILYFLLFKLRGKRPRSTTPCWTEKKCPKEIRKNCVTWIAHEGFYCWFLTGKSCRREKTLHGIKTETCFNCSFFRDNLKKIKSTGD